LRAGDTAQIAFIRHGKTEANEKRLYCGATDLPLSPLGRDELNHLKTQKTYPAAGLYITSGLSRANQTLSLLYGNPAFEVIDNLREMNFGDFELRSHDQLCFDPAYQAWLGDMENAYTPGGENKAGFTQRVIVGLSEVKSLCAKKAAAGAVIVTHGGVIVTVMEALFPCGKSFYEWQPPCGGGYLIDFSRPGDPSYMAIPQ